jgi:hypothetical protein
MVRRRARGDRRDRLDLARGPQCMPTGGVMAPGVGRRAAIRLQASVVRQADGALFA